MITLPESPGIILTSCPEVGTDIMPLLQMMETEALEALRGCWQVTEPRKGWSPAAPSPRHVTHELLRNGNIPLLGPGLLLEQRPPTEGSGRGQRSRWVGEGGAIGQTSLCWAEAGLPRAHHSQQPVLGP